MAPDPGFEVVTGAANLRPVERIPRDDPRTWRAVIGDELWFHFGLYAEYGANSLDAAGRRYFERQLDLAGIGAGAPLARVLDVGFGWGPSLAHLARRHPRCPRIDGIELGEGQVRYAAARLAAHRIGDRVRLYLGDAGDIEAIPDPRPGYDLVVLRGTLGHLPPRTLDATVRAIAARTAPGALMVISEILRTTPAPPPRAASEEVERQVCALRETVPRLARLLERHSFAVLDLRELPRPGDATRWLDEVRTNIERRLPDPPRPLADVRDLADNLSMALQVGLVGVYSVVARRVAVPPRG